MAFPWQNVLAAPAFIINMDDCPDRMTLTETRVRAAGYTDVRRHGAVDARTDNLSAEWAKYGSPAFDPHDREFVQWPGKQACELSWLAVLRRIQDEQIPFATVFEDDVLFHKDFATLAPAFWERTPKDLDLCYLGCQLDAPSRLSCIDRAPAFCTHAIMLTLAGAKRVYDFILGQPSGVYTIDCMLKNAEASRACPFVYYVWNATSLPDPAAVMPKDWTKRNHGLVFQDYWLGTFVREW